jgi:hypothetical protein
MVYGLEMALLVVTLAAMFPLIRRRIAVTA